MANAFGRWSAGLVLAAAAAGCSGTTCEPVYDEETGEYLGDSCEEEPETVFEIVIDILFFSEVEDEYDDEDDDYDVPEPPPWTRASRDLVRAAGEADPDASGTVSVATRFGWRHRFRVETRDVDGGAAEVLVEGPAGLVPAGFAVPDGAGRAVLLLDNGLGDRLPAGAATVQELAGRAVVVRGASGVDVLRAIVPGLRPGPAVIGSERFEDEGSGARARVRLRSGGAFGREVVRFAAAGLEPGAAVELRIDDERGDPVVAGAGTVDGEGRWAFASDSRRGDPPPAGAADAAALQGRGFDLSVGGVPVLEGALPQP